MHNRVRMIAASFLVKDLHLDWRAAPGWFMDHLVDGDLASNQHGWQWIAGTGTDAAPYFRIFNPVDPGRALRPAATYVRRWVPELAGASRRDLHQPWLDPAGLPDGLSAAHVDHAEEREEALAAWPRSAAASRAALSPRSDPPLRLALGSIECQPPAAPTHARRTQGRHPPGRRGGVHRHRAAGGVRARRASPRRAGVLGDRPQRHGHPSSRRATCASRTPAPAASPPRRATASSSTPSARPPRSRPRTPQQVRSFFEQAHGELEQMLQDTSRLLGDLTSYAGVVVGPAPTEATVRSVQVVGLTASSASWCWCCRAAPSRSTPSTSATAARWLPPSARSASAPPPPTSPPGSPERRARRCPRCPPPAIPPPTVCASWPCAPCGPTAARTPTRCSSGGTARIARAFDALDTVREVLGILEQQYVVVTLLRDVLDRGLQVAIGTETGMAPLAECALDRRPVPGRGRAGRHDRRPRPGPHGLPAGDGGGGRGEPSPLPAAHRRLMADYYELLELAARRHVRGHQAGVPASGPPAPPRHQPGPGGRGAVQGGGPGLRGPVGPGEAPALRPLRRRRRQRRRRQPVRRRGHQRHLRGLLRRRQPVRRGRPGPERVRRAAQTSSSSWTSPSSRPCSACATPSTCVHRSPARRAPARARPPAPSRSCASSAPASARSSACASRSSAR